MIVANPKQVRLIAHAKVKTDRIDAVVLAQLYASGFLPEVWIPDERTLALRRQVTRRNQLVRQRSRLKNIVQSILHAHLVPPCPAADLFGPKGRAWLVQLGLPEDERLAVERQVRAYDHLSDDLRVVERDLARHALADQNSRRLMTIPGIDMVVALGMLAAVSDVGRFARPQRGRLPRPEPERPAIRTGTGLRAGSPNKAVAMLVACWLRPPGRRQGRLVRCALLLADQRASWPARRCRRDRSQTGGDRLASAAAPGGTLCAWVRPALHARRSVTSNSVPGINPAVASGARLAMHT